MVSGTRTIEEVLSRKHAREVLVYLSETNDPDGAMSKALLMKRAGLKSANLTRLMNTLLEAGLTERLQRGREALYRLSIEGAKRAAELRAQGARYQSNDVFRPQPDCKIRTPGQP